VTGERSATRREHARLGTEPIDGLRGFAVLIVVCYHTWLFSWVDPYVAFFGRALPTERFVRPGYLGVDIFFVISAFCLTYPYVVARQSRARPPGVREFALRRALKILPSYALALGATFWIAIAAGQVPAGVAARVFWEHALFLQNLEYDRLGDSNSVLWSLAVEVQFYVVFPLLAWAFLRKPLITAAVMIALAQAYRHLLAGCCLRDESVMRLLPAYLDLFAAGMLAAHVVVVLPREMPALASRRWLFTALGLAGGCAVFALLGYADVGTYVKDARQWFAVSLRTAFGLAVGLFAAASCLANGWWRRAVGNRALAWLSLVSYNVYLWHTTIEIFLAKHHVPRAVTKIPHEDATWRWEYVTLSFVAIALVSVAITYFIERPILSLIKPQSFSYPYARLLRLARGRRDGSRRALTSQEWRR